MWELKAIYLSKIFQLSTIKNRNTEHSVRRCTRSSKEFVNILRPDSQFEGLLSLASSKAMNTIKFGALLKNQFTKSQQENPLCDLKKS